MQAKNYNLTHLNIIGLLIKFCINDALLCNLNLLLYMFALHLNNL